MYPMTDETSRKKREMALRYFIDEASQKRKCMLPKGSSADPIGSCLCDAILAHGVAYSQGLVIKQLLTKTISVVARLEGYSPGLRDKLLGAVSVARISRSTIQRRGMRQYALHKELVRKAVEDADGYSIILGILSHGEELRLLVAMNCLWPGASSIQTLLCGLPSLPPYPESSDILRALFQSVDAEDSMPGMVQRHHTFLQKLVWVSIYENSRLKYDEVKQTLRKARQDVAKDVLLPVFKIISFPQLSFLRDALSAHCDLFTVVTVILKGPIDTTPDGWYLDASKTDCSANVFDFDSGEVKEGHAWDKIHTLITNFFETQNQLDCLSLADLKTILRLIREHKDTLIHSMMSVSTTNTVLQQCIANLTDSKWLQNIYFIEGLVTVLAPFESMLAVPNACVLDVYAHLDRLHSILRDARDMLPCAAPDFLSMDQRCTKAFHNDNIAPEEASFYFTILSTYIDEISSILDCYSPYVSSFKLCTFTLSSITLSEITNSLNSIPYKLTNLTQIAEEYYSAYHRKATDCFSTLQSINQCDGVYEHWKTLVNFWSKLLHEYSLASRVMLFLLTAFSTPAIFLASKTMINNILSAQRSCLTETNSEAALLSYLNAQFHSKNIA
ncbi:Hypothetical protein GLP15_3981 [Giardia lamblia P15]|uniref:Uncharacterized protein n=1 Tax=Giardia intestinalis (strain P15) TaxID=658858 RepID=E1F1V2_GIAIA|nr:Hypothetical protein GLP15_3981 [Giardia lamblia P15]